MKRVTIVTGHYGSGKSEFAINLALRTVSAECPVALIDLDVVNPYFRSRERRGLLEKHAVRVIGNTMGQDVGVDVPAISAEMYGPLQDENTSAIIDAGGDPVGARVLGSVRHVLPAAEDCEVLCVLNASRPETQSAEQVISLIYGIERESGLRVSALVNNTHMLEHTSAAELARGYALCCEVGRRLELPTLYHGVLQSLVEEVPAEWSGEIVPIAMHLREAWMHDAG